MALPSWCYRNAIPLHWEQAPYDVMASISNAVEMARVASATHYPRTFGSYHTSAMHDHEGWARAEAQADAEENDIRGLDGFGADE